MKLSRILKLILCIFSFNQYIDAFRIKNTLRYPIEYTRAREPDEWIKRGEKNIMIKPGDISENIITKKGNAPIEFCIYTIGSYCKHKVILQNIAPSMSKQELASADTIFDTIEITEKSYNPQSQKHIMATNVTLAPPKTSQEKKKEEAEAEELPAAPGGPKDSSMLSSSSTGPVATTESNACAK
jgi:hypothetical protein